VAYGEGLAEVTGKLYGLLTEAEGEKAASWDVAKQQKRIWPWGNNWNADYVNCAPSGPGRTTPRRQYSPAGDSPYGCADMAGNVWEWCNSLYRPYPYAADDGREDLAESRGRVLRGGSWYNKNPATVRCAYRVRNFPDYGDVSGGFRVARSSLK